MPDIVITTECVARLVNGLNQNKATGPDDIPARTLQLTANEFAPVLQIIFPKSRSPLVFLTYINDLPNNIHSSIRPFEDDCVLYREIKKESDSQELQKDLNSLMKWEYDWQMHSNPQTCFVMRLTHARHLTRFIYILGDTSLQEIGIHPYLGVHITKYLTWNKHIHQITATANRTLAF